MKEKGYEELCTLKYLVNYYLLNIGSFLNRNPLKPNPFSMFSGR